MQSSCLRQRAQIECHRVCSAAIHPAGIKKSSHRVKDIRWPPFRPQRIATHHEDLILNRSCFQECPPGIVPDNRPAGGNKEHIKTPEGHCPWKFREPKVVADDEAAPDASLRQGSSKRPHGSPGTEVAVVFTRTEEMDLIVAVDETSAVEHKTCVGRGRVSTVKIDASRNAIAGHRAGSVRKGPKNCIAGVVRPRAGFEGRVTAVNHLGKDKKV